MRLPIGTLLVDQGVLTPDQCEQVLERQRVTHRPFGEIAEEMFGVESREVERAWAKQYATLTKWIDPRLEPMDPAVRDLVTRRQAWQFRVLPIGYDGAELMVCTTQSGLIRAMNFTARQLPLTCYFVLCEPRAMGEALMRVYPMDGMSWDLLEGESPAWQTGLKRAS